jgi:hypothetical protein
VTAIGSDGYYPLGIASAQATRIEQILPYMKAQARSDKLPISPGRLWRFLCVVVLVLCLSHVVVLCVANYWSPFTRELAVGENDQPRRRAMYIHIGTAMLWCMAFVLAVPLFPTFRFCQFDLFATVWSVLTLAMGVVSVAFTFWKTWNYIGSKSITSPVMQAHETPQSGRAAQSDKAEHLFLLHEQSVYFSFNLIAWVTLLAVPLIWSYLCYGDHAGGLAPDTSDVGLFFSFRCVHPGSGVSPVVPVLLLLLSWYLWAVFQTWRLRFSNNSRPMLPGRLKLDTSYPLFVADDDFYKCDHAPRVCLYKNITCLLITREILWRFLKALVRDLKEGHARAFEIALVGLYLILFAVFVLFIPVKSLDAFFWASRVLPTPYEFLVTALFFTLLVIVVTGWIRIIFVWGALKRGLLDRLENLPIRFAFNRLKTERRMTMMRQGGLREQWRDMARSTESMRQIVNDPDLEACITKIHSCGATFVPNSLGGLNAPLDALLSWIRSRRPAPNPLRTIKDELDLHIDALVKHIGGEEPNGDL